MSFPLNRVVELFNSMISSDLKLYGGQYDRIVCAILASAIMLGEVLETREERTEV